MSERESHGAAESDADRATPERTGEPKPGGPEKQDSTPDEAQGAAPGPEEGADTA